MHHIAILNDIILAFYPHFSSFFYLGFAAVTYKIIISNYFCTNEAFFEVGVDNACSLWSRIAYGNGPGSYFLFAGSKKEKKFRLRRVRGLVFC